MGKKVSLRETIFKCNTFFFLKYKKREVNFFLANNLIIQLKDVTVNVVVSITKIKTPFNQ